MDRALENALRFISETLSENPYDPLSVVVERACQKFDLTPAQGENLLRTYLEQKGQKK
ncbi:MAG TPA: hypothetical protein VF857_11480 [Spirochaetota bacterium]